MSAKRPLTQTENEENKKAEEERTAKKLQEEIVKILSNHALKSFSFVQSLPESVKRESKANSRQTLDKDKILKTTCNYLSCFGDYCAEGLREIFEWFGT